MRPVVLLLSTYPFVEPRHGGQVRLANIARVYEAAGWQVERIAVYEPEAHGGQRLGKNDVPFPMRSPYRLFGERSVPFVSDLQSGEYAAAEGGGFVAIKARLPKKIHAIHVEQPWLWPLACKIKGVREHRGAITIFGSQNIEAPLKREIFSSYEVSDTSGVIAAIDQLERQAAREADLTLAVTQADLDVLNGYGAKESLLAPNGIAPWSATKTAIETWLKRLPPAPWILYVASAHPPNFTGFTTCVGETLGCIPPDSRLVVAGSVSTHLYQVLASTRWHSLNLSRIELLGHLSDDDLAAVKTLAHAYLLPIQHGGGSNIKTAEALYSGAYVIGSEAAFRGYESFVNLPEVVVARSPEDFQSAMRDVLQRSAKLIRPPVEGELRYQLRWDQSLAALPDRALRVMENVEA